MASRLITKRKKKQTLREKFRYDFDNIMSEGLAAKIGVLMAVTIIVIVLLGLLAALIPHNGQSLLQLVWQSFLHALDPGTIAGDTDFSIYYVAIMLIVTLFGVMFTGTLISIINNSMEAKMSSLAKGKSQIYEQYTHTVVLGFQDTTVDIITELIKANSNQKHKCPVMILDDEHTPEEMNEIIDDKIEKIKAAAEEAKAQKKQKKSKDAEQDTEIINWKRTKVICRKGSIYDAEALNTCAFEACDSIIVNGKNDFETIKSLLAVSTKLEELKNAGKMEQSEIDLIPIVAIISETENEQEATYAGGPNVRVLCYDKIISKIIAGAGREAGLSFVYSDLFNFDGAEFYCSNNDTEKLNNLSKTEQDRMLLSTHLGNAIVVGAVPEKDTERAEELMLFPTSPVSETGTCKKYIVLQQDDDPINILKEAKFDETAPIKETITHDEPEQYTFVILGDSPILEQILVEGNLAFAGRKMTDNKKPCTVLIASRNDRIECISNDKIHKYPNLDVQSMMIDICEKDLKRVINRARRINGKLNSVIILAKEGDPIEADEETLRKLIFLRHIRDEENRRNKDSEEKNETFNITCEIRSDSNSVLAQYSGANDFIVGSSIMATITVQVAQTPELYEVFQEILSSKGSEIYMENVADYFNFADKDSLQLNYVDMIRAAASRNEVWIGISQPKVSSGFIQYVPRLVTALYDKNGNPLGKEIGRTDQFVVIAPGPEPKKRRRNRRPKRAGLAHAVSKVQEQKE